MAERKEPFAKNAALDENFLPIERRVIDAALGGQRGFLVLRLLLAGALSFQVAQIASPALWLEAVPLIYAAAAVIFYLLATARKLSDEVGPWAFLIDVGASVAVLHSVAGNGLNSYMALLILIMGACLLRKPALIFTVSIAAVLCYALVMMASPDEFLRDLPLRLSLFLLISLFSVQIVDYAAFIERQTARRYEERLAWMQRLSMVGQAMAAVLHEAKTPLGSVVLNAESAAAMLKKGKKPEAELRIIAEQADQAAVILQNFLDFVKPTRLELQPLRAHAPLIQAAEMLKIRLDERDVALDLRTRADCPILGSPRHLLQAFTNLLSNALDAMPSGGTLSVWMEKHRGGVQIHFKDDGQGLTPEALATLFEPFTTSKADDKGHGLGLSIVRWIVQEHDGDVVVRSEGPGKGAEVEVRLPLAEKS
jgi:signal transduction histidine kinase